VRINVLGPIEVWTGGDQPVRLVGQRQRALLAALALDHDKVVPVARLVDVLWDTHPPATAAAKVQAHVSGLRQALGHNAQQAAGPLVTRPPGYLLSCQGIEMDLAEFDTLVSRGTAAIASGQPGAVSDLLASALALWRGAACADVASPLIQATAKALEERRLLAVEAKAEADLVLGQYERITAEVPTWLAAHPLRERLRALLMLAHYRRGSRAQALLTHRAGREAIVAELGLEPGPQLRRLHQLILADDPALQTHPVNSLLGLKQPHTSLASASRYAQGEEVKSHAQPTEGRRSLNSA